jgi:photosystem II stability/assembly factor-like uncharacterized protein
MAADIATVTATSGWSVRSGGLSTAQYYGIASSPDGRLILAGSQDQGLHRYGSGTGWGFAQDYTDFSITQIDQDDPSYVYAETIYLGILRTSDGGRRWPYIAQNLPDTGYANFSAPIRLDPSNQRRLYAGGRSLYVTADARATIPAWTEVKTPSAAGADNYISKFEIASSNSNVIWVGHNNGEVYMTTNGLASSPTWTRITNTNVTRLVGAIHIDRNDPNHVFIGYGGTQGRNVIVTTNGGASWTDITSDLPTIFVSSILQSSSDPATLYVGTSTGVYTSTNGGQNWTTSDAGPGGSPITGLTLIPRTGGLLVSTYNRGAFLLSNAAAPIAVAAPTPTLRAGVVFSSAQAVSQSFFRFFNTGVAPGTVTATLTDISTGQQLKQWTSPSIPGGAEFQYFISALEDFEGTLPSKPAYYSLNIQSQFPGYFQHVLYRPADGTLTNLSTCGSGVTTDYLRLSGVHSSQLAAYPSSIVAHSTDNVTRAVVLGIYDARDGTRLGTYTTNPIIAGMHAIVPVSAIEAAIGVTPGFGMFHYIVRAESAFNGYLQHLVNNMQAGVITDMTTACALDGNALVVPSAPLQPSAVLSTTQTVSQSFLRFYNTGAASGGGAIILYRPATYETISYTSLPNPMPGAELQLSVADLEPTNVIKPDTYGVQIPVTFPGYFQHVLYRPEDGTLTNLSTCGFATTADPGLVIGVHTSKLATLGFPSSIVINNTGSAPQSVTLGVYDSRDGNKLGTYVSPSISAGGAMIPTVAAIEVGANITVSPDILHYIIKAEGPFTGFLQHLVNNQQRGVITDMTTACALVAGF